MGRGEFSAHEAENIRHLLQRKIRADRGEQKMIRDSIRRIGFYITDYTSSSEGFTPSDFDSLIERGEVVITGQPPPKAPETIPANPHRTNAEMASRALPRQDSQAMQRIPPRGVMDFVSLEGIMGFGFRGFHTIAHLQATGCEDVPRVPGVYLVLRIEKRKPTFLKKSVGGFFKGNDPTVPVQELHDNWVDGPLVLNIGKAGCSQGKATLKGRLKQYMDFGTGKPVGHGGGRYIWQLAGSDKLEVCWMPTPSEEPENVEKRLIQMFKGVYGKRPFANLKD